MESRFVWKRRKKQTIRANAFIDELIAFWKKYYLSNKIKGGRNEKSIVCSDCCSVTY